MKFYIILAIVAISFAGLRQLVVAIRKNRSNVADEERRRNIPPFITVNTILRPDGSERLRIFQRPEGSFGVCLERAIDGGLGWYPPTSPGTGSVYASVEIAVREVSVTLPWCKSVEET